LLSYHITEDPLEDKYTKRVPKKVLDQIQGFHKKITRKPKEMIPQLMDFIKKYPNAPLFVSFREACMTCISKNVTIGYLSTQKRITDDAEK
jgi:hypothetical protein